MDRRSQRRPVCRQRQAGRADPARLAELKAAIKMGTYETPEKLEHALRNLLADLRRVHARSQPKNV